MAQLLTSHRLLPTAHTMQRLSFIRRLDPGYLVVLGICLLALWPFVGRASLPQETDAELHIFRLAELAYLVQGGELYPRWAPNFYHGYGYPIFNYYAPLSYYLGLPVALLPGLDAVDGVKFVFVLGLLAAAFGSYGLVRDQWGRPAGYIAAAAYLYAPYIQYIDPIARGVLAESFSLGLFPLALWAMARLRQQQTTDRWVIASLLLAAVILSHNLMGLLLFGLVTAWVIWTGVMTLWAGDPPPTLTRHGWLLAALLVGWLLAAFFWLPVLLERNAVNLNTLIGAGDNYDFRTHFLSWRELLRATRWLDWGATEPRFAFNLGVGQWLFGGLGLFMLIRRRLRHAAQVAFFALGLAGLLFLMLPISTFIWEAVPVLPYFQFPWRLLGAAALMLAVLAGVGVAALAEQLPWPDWGQQGVVAAAVLLLITLGLPLTQPAPWPDFGPLSPLRMSLIEHSGRWLGTTSTADYVPATVDMIPERNGYVVAGFSTGEPLDRVNRLTLPEGAVVTGQERGPLYFQYQVYTPEPFPLRLFLFAFPGWTVRVDGAVVATELGRPEGFIVVPLTAGEHEVTVRFGDTPARRLAWGISGLALLLLAVGGWRLAANKAALPIHLSATLLDKGLFAAALLLTGITIFVFAPLSWLHHHSADYRAIPARHQVWADFDGQIALIGYETNRRTARPGDTLEVTLYWQAQRPQSENYQVFVHLLAPDGFLSAQSDKLNPGDFPTHRWPLDKYVLDDHTLALPLGLAPGVYTVMTGLWLAPDGGRLPVRDAAGEPVGEYFVLYELVVRE